MTLVHACALLCIEKLVFIVVLVLESKGLHSNPVKYMIVRIKCSPEMPVILGLRVRLRWDRAPYYTLGHFLQMLSLI